MTARIYIAGPYTQGDVALNVRKAVQVADEIAKLGVVPFIPHLSHFWHLIRPHEYEFWINQDLEWLKSCHALYRIQGESRGADMEVLAAISQKKRVFKSMRTLRVWIKKNWIH